MGEADYFYGTCNYYNNTINIRKKCKSLSMFMEPQFLLVKVIFKPSQELQVKIVRKSNWNGFNIT